MVGLWPSVDGKVTEVGDSVGEEETCVVDSLADAVLAVVVTSALLLELGDSEENAASIVGTNVVSCENVSVVVGLCSAVDGTVTVVVASVDEMKICVVDSLADVASTVVTLTLESDVT